MAITTTSHEIHEVLGREVTLPVRVRAATQASATWSVDADAAQAIIEPSGLAVARGRRGTTTCSVAVVDYLDNDLGRYHEVAVAFAVAPHDAGPGWTGDPRRPVTLIHRLPVDGEFTCAAGREIWGFPKWVTEIDLRRHGRSTECVLRDRGAVVLALQIAPGGVPLPAKPLEMSAYSFLDGVLRRTPWTTTSHGAHLRPGGAVLELGTDHPMADELRTLGVHERSPRFSVTVETMTATFGAAEVVGA